MRALCLGLLILLPLLAPLALAQQQGFVTVVMEPPRESIMPLAAPTQIPVKIEADCPASAAASGIDVRYAITRLPPWASATVSPTTGHMDFSQCAGNPAVFHAIVSVSVTDRAPAFVPEPLELTATTQPPPASPGATGRGSVPIAAAFYSLLDVQAPVTQLGAAPRDIVSFPVHLTNLGNSASKVSFEKVEADEGAVPAVPPPVILASVPGGGSDGATLVNVQAYRVAGVSGTQSFTLRYQAAYILDAKLLGASGTLTFRLVPRTASENATDPAPPPSGLAKLAPGPSLPLALVPLGVAALAWGRRRAS